MESNFNQQRFKSDQCPDEGLYILLIENKYIAGTPLCLNEDSDYPDVSSYDFSKNGKSYIRSYVLSDLFLNVNRDEYLQKKRIDPCFRPSYYQIEQHKFVAKIKPLSIVNHRNDYFTCNSFYVEKITPIHDFFFGLASRNEIKGLIKCYPNLIGAHRSPSEEMMLIAIEKDPNTIKNIMDPTETVCLVAMKKDGLLIDFCKHRLSEKVIQAALENNPEVIGKLRSSEVKFDCYDLIKLIERNPYVYDRIREEYYTESHDFALLNVLSTKNYVMSYPISCLSHTEENFGRSNIKNLSMFRELSEKFLIELTSENPKAIKYIYNYSMSEAIMRAAFTSGKDVGARKMFNEYEYTFVKDLNMRESIKILGSSSFTFDELKSILNDRPYYIKYMKYADDFADLATHAVHVLLSSPDEVRQRKPILKYITVQLKMDYYIALLLQNSVMNFVHIPSQSITYEMCLIALKKEPKLFKNIPDRFISKELLLIAAEHYDSIKHFPVHDLDFYKTILQKDPKTFMYMSYYVRKELADVAFYHGDDETIKYIPLCARTERMYLKHPEYRPLQKKRYNIVRMILCVLAAYIVMKFM